MKSTKNSIFIYLVSTNHGEFVEQALKSLVNQTERNFDLLLIDNGCDDATFSYFEKYIEAFDNASVHRFQTRQTLQNVANFALKCCQCEFITRLDADDYLHVRAVAELRSAIRHNIDIIYGNFVYIDRLGKVIGRHSRFKLGGNVVHDEPAHGACTLLRTEKMREIGGWRTEFTCQDGFDVWLRLYKGSNIAHVETEIFYYRQLGDSLSRQNRQLIFDTRIRMVLRNREVEGGQKNKNYYLFLLPTFGTDGQLLEAVAKTLRIVEELRLASAGEVEVALGASEENRMLLAHIASSTGMHCYFRTEEEKNGADFFPFVQRIAAIVDADFDTLTVANTESLQVSVDYLRGGAIYLRHFQGRALMTGCRMEKSIFVPKIGGVERLDAGLLEDSRRFVLHKGGMFVFRLDGEPVSRREFLLLELDSEFK